MAEKGQKFQWAKGENQGKLEIYSTNDGEFMEFESGRRCNQSLIGDFIVQINDESEILEFDDPLTKVVKPKATKVVKPEKVAAKVIKETLKSPLIPLLDKTKKRKTKINLRLDISLPSKAFLNVMEENFEEDIIEVLSEYVVNDIENPKKYLEDAVKRSISEWYKYTNKTKQKDNATK
mgnify:CR=1 FL=1